MKKITEYRFGDSLIIGVDHGYGNVKTRHTVTKTDVIKQEKSLLSAVIIPRMAEVISSLGKVTKDSSLTSRRIWTIMCLPLWQSQRN